MIRILTLCVILGGLCACETPSSPGSYGVEAGDADYNSLKAATDTCKARGGTLQLKDHGDTRNLGDYVCKIGKAN